MKYGSFKTISVRLTDWIAGKVSGITFQDLGIDWGAFFSDPEKQSDPKFDSDGCTDFSLSNVIETQCNQQWSAGKFSDQQKTELTALKVVSGNRFNFSDRALAKMSGTTRSGNELQTVVDTARTEGLVAESLWPFTQDMDWDTFYATIPQSVIDQAKSMLDYIDIAYEWVILNKGENVLEVLKYHLKQAPIWIAIPICPGWATGNVKSCPMVVTQHAVMVYRVDEAGIHIIDQYAPFVKLLALDYPIPFAMKVVVTAKKPIAFKKDLKFGDISPDVAKLQKFLNSDPDTQLSAGSGSTGQETTYYGAKTADAVLRFQKKYHLVSWFEIMWYQGKLAGVKTRAKLNELVVG